MELVEGCLFKDIVAFESIRNSDKIRRLLMMIAFQIGKEVSLSELATNLGIARQTVERYLDLVARSISRSFFRSRESRNDAPVRGMSASVIARAVAAPDSQAVALRHGQSGDNLSMNSRKNVKTSSRA